MAPDATREPALGPGGAGPAGTDRADATRPGDGRLRAGWARRRRTRDEHLRGEHLRRGRRPPDRKARSGRVGAALALGLLATAVAAGCANDGRSLAAPGTDQTTTTRAVADSTVTSAADISLTSESFTDGGTIPDAHTCRGGDIAPSLAWSGIPSGTVELAVVVREVGDEGFVHWVVAGIPATVGGIAEGVVPMGAVEALNDFGRPGWGGPCPEPGAIPRFYEVQLYALSEASGMTPETPAGEAVDLVEHAFTTGTAVLSGTVPSPPAP